MMHNFLILTMRIQAIQSMANIHKAEREMQAAQDKAHAFSEHCKAQESANYGRDAIDVEVREVIETTLLEKP